MIPAGQVPNGEVEPQATLTEPGIFDGGATAIPNKLRRNAIRNTPFQ